MGKSQSYAEWIALVAVVACSACSSRFGVGQERVEKTSNAVIADVTIQLQTPRGVGVTTPVLLASNSVTIGANAAITEPTATASTIALGVGLDAQPDSSLGEVWSRGPATLR